MALDKNVRAQLKFLEHPQPQRLLERIANRLDILEAEVAGTKRLIDDEKHKRTTYTNLGGGLTMEVAPSKDPEFVAYLEAKLKIREAAVADWKEIQRIVHAGQKKGV